MTICGILRLDDEPADQARVRAMLAATVVGGGSRWTHTDGPLAMAATASVPTGPSPEVHVTDGLVVVARGRIDRPTGDGLAPPAARVAAAYRARGPAAFDELTGDWLVAVWEAAGHRLVLARAMNGSRRLLSWSDGRSLVFGTEFGQLAAAGVPTRLDQTFVAEHLCRLETSTSATPMAGVERLAEGELLTARTGSRPTRRVFDTLRDTLAEPVPVDLATAAAGLRLRLEQGVEAALPADGAATVLVSGGVDSSIVTALAHRMASSGRWIGKLVPAGMVYPGRRHDESNWLDILQAHLGLEILRFEPVPYDWDRWRRWTAATWDPPMRPNAAMADTVAGSLVGEGVTVALTGEGGDDWFRGSPMHWPDLLRARRLGTVWAETPAGLRPAALKHRARLVWGNGLKPLLRRPPALEVPAWVNQSWLERLGVPERVAAADAADLAAARSNDHLHRWSPANRRTGVPVFESVQQRFGWHGLDWRHPMHDRRVVEYALGLHPSVLYSCAGTKRVLRAAARDLLPAEIADRRGKAAFDDVVADAIEARGGTDALADHPMVKEGWVDLDPARQYWERMQARRRAGNHPSGAGEHVSILWPLFAAATWLEEVPLS